MRHPAALLALVIALAATAARAETDLAPGSFLRQTQHWDSEQRKFVPGAATGEGGACWQVISRSEHEVVLKHVSGEFHPFWSDKVIHPGSQDTWFDSDAFRKQNPGKPPLTQIRTIFETVATCHEPS
mgnify:CR=1 FL=1